MAKVVAAEKQYIDAFLKLTLRPASAADVFPLLSSMTAEQRRDFEDLASSNHVLVRAFEVINRVAGNRGNTDIQAWAISVLSVERARIAKALSYLERICNALDEEDCPTVVMKTLDHCPDLGNDLDLVTTGDRNRILHVFKDKFQARVEGRSWGDRLANKWNFSLPELPELVEAHIGRLGQTGEHVELAKRFIDRRILTQFNGHRFFMPAPEERIFAATLQRIYRHFYFRVCDILNTAALIETGEVDFLELRRAADHAGIWKGVATFVNIVSDYVKQYRGACLNVPSEVVAAAAVGADKMYTKARFLRLPVIPYAARLYTRQITEAAIRGNVPATFRLSLLPPLASVAAVAFKLTGSDKGVW